MESTAEVVMEQPENNTDQKILKEINTFKVIFNKQKYDISFDLYATVAQLKEHLHSVIGVPKEMQKVMVKGLAKDDKSLKECGITSGSKVMVIGSTFDDVLALSRPSVPVCSVTNMLFSIVPQNIFSCYRQLGTKNKNLLQEKSHCLNRKFI